MTDFRKFSALIRSHFDEMSKGELYVVDISGDELWDAYLAAFPAGTNEIYRTRREFDCSADRNFVKNVGNVVQIDKGSLISVWDAAYGRTHGDKEIEYPFNIVSEKLAELVRSKLIKTVFRTKESTYGVEVARELLADGKVHNWYNFYVKIAAKHKTDKPEEIRGKLNTEAQVFRRGLEELTPYAVKTVKDLVHDEMFYRSEEHKTKVYEFATLHAKYSKLNSDEARNIFIWENIKENINSYLTGFKNEVIGSLVVDLSNGIDIETAVKKFESKVAPANYKRSKSLITPAMIRDAMKTINELGLGSALERRHARISDVGINDVLFVDNSVRGAMKGGIEGLLMSSAVTKTPDLKNPVEINIKDFLETVVPNAKSIEVAVKNSHSSNFVSLTAPIHDEVERLFKWDNNFAWSYDGNVTDSDLRQKVSAAGGRVDGVLRFSHTWNYDGNNQSLMDLHVFMPGCEHTYPTRITNGEEIHDNYGGGRRRVGWNNRQDVTSGGIQDVDFVKPPGKAVPVENITFPDINRMPEGKYVFKIHNWQFRNVTTSGFKAEIEFGGQIFTYEYPKALKNKQWITLAEVMLKNGVFTIEHKLDSKAVSQEKWGVKTETLVPVDSIVLSPNHWEGKEIGNKHWFFILKDCLNPEPVRGIYNEFLSQKLDKHRKVFEILGDKTKAEPVNDQLSGIGFSSTKRDSLTAVVRGDKTSKVYQINF